MDIQIKRTYEASEPADGYRVLVDRLWPRGIKKENLHMDLWAKTIAPSTECRKAFNHDPARFAEYSLGGASHHALFDGAFRHGSRPRHRERHL